MVVNLTGNTNFYEVNDTEERVYLTVFTESTDCRILVVGIVSIVFSRFVIPYWV